MVPLGDYRQAGEKQPRPQVWLIGESMISVLRLLAGRMPVALLLSRSPGCLGTPPPVYFPHM